MLEQKDIDYIDNNLFVYDQNWRMYQLFLGEPFLLNDCLVYFDGSILFVCAFPFKKNIHVDLNDIWDAFRRVVPFAKVEIIDIWGTFTIDKFVEKNSSSKILDFTPPNPKCFDSIVDIASFSLKSNKKARLAYNSCINKKVICKIVQRKILTYQHIILMKNFIETHKLHGPHTTIFLSLANLISDPNTFIVEAYDDNCLIGFAILMKVSNKAAVYCLACYDHATRAADATLYNCIDFCKTNGLLRLHLGYSANESLLQFKSKWGGSLSGIEYQEYFISLTENTDLISKVNDGLFLWKDRLFCTSKSVF